MRAPIRLIIKTFNIYDGRCTSAGRARGEGRGVICIAVIERARFAPCLRCVAPPNAHRAELRSNQRIRRKRRRGRADDDPAV